jgi:hypothetical protein
VVGLWGVKDKKLPQKFGGVSSEYLFGGDQESFDAKVWLLASWIRFLSCLLQP